MIELQKEKSVTELYELYSDDIRRYAFSILNNIEESNDAVQEVFLRYQNFEESFNGNCSYKTWLFTLTRNICYNKLKEVRNKDVRLDTVSFKFRREENIEDFITLKEALNKLTPEENEIIYLKDFEMYSYKEIAVLLEISLDNVKVKLFRAKKKLKNIIEG